MKYLNLILLSSTWQLNHRKGLHSELNNKLSKWSDVVFIESPFSLLVHTFIKFKSRVLSKLRNNGQVDEVKTYSPIILFHSKFWNKIPLCLRIDSWLIYIQLSNYIRKYFPKHELILWADFPFNFPFISKLKKKILIYDFYDNYSYDADGNFNYFRDNLNKKMVKNSDLIFCTGRVMYNFAKLINEKTYYLPNGHNMSLKSLQIEKADLGIQGKIIGYMGNIRDWIDFELIKDIVNNLGTNEFLVMIGPVEKNVSKEINELKQNLHFKHIESVEYEKIFSFIKAFDIGIIPFKVNKFTEGVLPYKFFEYIAAEVRIISTALPELLQFKEIINVAYNNDEFINMCIGDIEKLNKDDIQYARLRKESTWDERAEFIVSKLKEVLTS